MRGIDEVAVGRWLTEHVDGAVAPFRFELIAGGRSNLTFKVTGADGHPVVLRRPPLGHVLATAHDMAREHRIIAAVGPAGIPVPAALGLCADDTVNGAPFYVMGYVEGVVLDTPDKASLLAGADARRRASEDLVVVLADLHALDVDTGGLGDLARHDGYLERQLRRWSTQWAGSKTRELAAIEEVERRLRADPPRQQGTSVVHGDYRFGNMLVSPGGEVRAVLDWELCTLGDPLADVGWLLVYWSDPGEDRRQNDPTAAGGFLTRAELVARYGELTGRDLSRIAYYEAFGYWRLAVISEGVYARYRNGVMGDDEVDLVTMGEGTVRLAEAALRACEAMGH
jgi:aminoglycoside phosphotransferase (APT) family kinase protein